MYSETAVLVCLADPLSGVCITARFWGLRWILWSPISFAERPPTGWCDILSSATEGGAERVSGAPVFCLHALHALLKH